jgi:predicted nucleotide-binding protein
VFALKREGDLELPNDIAGLVDTPYDAAGHWRLELVRELKAAGYTVDANRLI